jgi:GT2 family glycosyltransferase
MKLSIVIICWNDKDLIDDCLRSIVDTVHETAYEVIVSDNGSTDGSVEMINDAYPQVRVIENGANLGFARANNVGIREARGRYVLILNPDTIIAEGAIDRWISWADGHSEAGAFGCRVLNPDGSYQEPARPFPTIWRSWVSVFRLGWLGRYSPLFSSNRYVDWAGTTEREIDWQYGCCVLFRADVLAAVGGFDEQFFYHFEEVDLCYRVREAGYTVRYLPDAVITHLGGQSVGRAPTRFYLEQWRNRYRYFYKRGGARAARQCRMAALAWLIVRFAGYGAIRLFSSSRELRDRLHMYAVAIRWHRRIDPVRFVRSGEEPDVGYAPVTGVRLEGSC